MLHEYKLPSLGDGVTGKVIEILVKPGDKVTKEQIVIIVGTDKVDAEMPVDSDGIIADIAVKKGDDVSEGSLILKIETAGEAQVAAPAPAAVPTPAPAAPEVAATPAQTTPAPAPAQSTPAPAAAAGSYDFKLPSLGDGVTGKVIDFLVKPGDQVKKEQVVIIVGTDKVDAEMPVDTDGTITEILVKKGDDVGEGALILRLTPSGATPAAPPAGVTAPAAATPAPPPLKDVPSPPIPVSTPATNVASNLRVSPLARKRAKEFGINISDVHAAEGATRISYKDVVAYVKTKIDSGGGSTGGGGSNSSQHKKLPNFEKFGAVERQAQSRIGVLTAENMHYAFNAIPHAWISEKADITHIEDLRQKYKEQVKAAGGSLTTTAIITKIVADILKKMPQFNSSYDIESHEIIYKKFYNIGIAVDTPRGLLVPVIRNVDQKNLTQISVDLTEISTRTRDGKNKPDDLDGGTFTISNIGGIGGTNMLSIVNWPQVAILSVTAATIEAVWNESKGAFEPRLLMPMSIGWDHRVINGADAARFLKTLKQTLEEPFSAWI